MKTAKLILILVLSLFLWSYGDEKKTQEKGPFGTFFAVHMEAGSGGPRLKWQEKYWPSLVRFVEMANQYDARLTLMFNPQWAEYILKDQNKFSLVKSWQKKGHEIALHYHNIYHGDYNGYTNRKGERFTKDPRYRGTVKDMMSLLQQLAAPEKVQTMCMGPKPNNDSVTNMDIDEVDYPDGIVFDVDGVNVGLGKILKTSFRGREIFHLKHHFLETKRQEHLKMLQEDFEKATGIEVLGVVTHAADFDKDPLIFEKWLKFVTSKKMKIKTVREIVDAYPKNKMTAVKYTPQKEGDKREMQKARLIAKMERLHELLREKKAEGLDTSRAEELDRESRQAAQKGDFREVERLLDEAIKLVWPSEKAGIFKKVQRLHEILREKKAKGLDTSRAEELDRKSRQAAQKGDFREVERLLDEAIKTLENLGR